MEQQQLEPSIVDLLNRAGMVGPAGFSAHRLSGGVSSDIWKVEARGRTLVVKRALPALRVSQVWEAPLSRSANEVEWLEEVARILPHAVPHVLFHDADAAVFAMEFVDYPVWKGRLRDGCVDTVFAAAVGEAIATVHSRTAGSARVAERFANDETFDALRVDPYLIATAVAHPDLAGPLRRLAADTLANKCALVHGDVSPKNILIGAAGPIFLDAECAWYGEPAFDLAFCLNHLLLKCVWVPSRRQELLSAFDVLGRAYLERVDWEPSDHMEARAARLLPALLLARVDGKSPVEYITDEAEKERIRRVARPHIVNPPLRLSELRNAWMRALSHA